MESLSHQDLLKLHLALITARDLLTEALVAIDLTQDDFVNYCLAAAATQVHSSTALLTPVVRAQQADLKLDQGLPSVSTTVAPEDLLE
jgi:hypothetical protein